MQIRKYFLIPFFLMALITACGGGSSGSSQQSGGSSNSSGSGTASSGSSGQVVSVASNPCGANVSDCGEDQEVDGPDETPPLKNE